MESSSGGFNHKEEADTSLPSLNMPGLTLLNNSEELEADSPTSTSGVPWDSPNVVEGEQFSLLNESIQQESEEEILHRQRRLTMMVTEDDDSEYVTSSTWREKQHIFVLTEAGKPVYSRHGSEDKLSSIMGVMLAIVSCVHDRNDTIRSIIAGKHKFVFLIRIPLILVAVCSTSKTIEQVKLHLGYVYDTILSTVTLSQLNKIYDKQKNFDLRRLLTGTDKFLDHLCDSIDSDPQYLLGAVKPLPMNVSQRDAIGESLKQAKTDDLVFAVLLFAGKVVSICSMKSKTLETNDLQLLINLVNASSTSFLVGESWLPVCLPNFSPDGYLHAHISYLDESLQTCLILLSADKDSFFTLCNCKKKVVARLEKHNCFDALRRANEKADYYARKINIPDVRHFLYKSLTTNQIPYEYTSPVIDPPYNTPVQKKRLFDLYQHLHGKIHNPAAPLKLHYCVSDHETLLGWHAQGFELYAVFDPLIKKQQAIATVDRFLRWIKQREDDVFMMKPHVF